MALIRAGRAAILRVGAGCVASGATAKHCPLSPLLPSQGKQCRTLHRAHHALHRYDLQLVANTTRGASNSSTGAPAAAAQVPATQPQPGASGHTRPEEDEWTEVVDEKTDRPYWWNQRTGETTELGEPRPTSRFHNAEWEEAARGSSGPFQDGWREPPGRDRTYLYSLIGSVIGITMGWLAQYTH